MTLTEVASRINAHLKRFEGDPAINRYADARREQDKLRPYYFAHANRAGGRVSIQYVAYQGGSCISKADAEKYLTWLDAGNVGRHFQALGS